MRLLRLAVLIVSPLITQTFSSNPPRVPVPKLVAMATDVASGLSYLECMEYVHTDIAVRNCLVTDDLGVKVAGLPFAIEIPVQMETLTAISSTAHCSDL